ncbi:hypothetical protein K502DRAFT_366151 [Neoconidiobolus thromboides FSU 785]|nr:hypothetical protein K502DRAFT_366151 [Neoconidiobolus thromboides FSU 785]
MKFTCVVLSIAAPSFGFLFHRSSNSLRNTRPDWSWNTGNNGSGNYGGCREGAMFCDYNSGGFYTCAQGRYVLRQCGPGTRCQQQGQDNVFCFVFICFNVYKLKAFD